MLADYGAARTRANSLNNGLDFELWPGIAYGPAPREAPRSPPARSAQAAGRRARAPHPAHAVRLRLLRPRGVPRRRRRRSTRPAHARPPARSRSRRSRCCATRAGCCRSTPRGLKSIALIGPEADELQATAAARRRSTPFTLRRRRAQAIDAARRAGRHGRATTTAATRARGRGVARARRRRAVVFVADYETEGSDKPCMGLNCGAARPRRPRRADRGGRRRATRARSWCSRRAARC